MIIQRIYIANVKVVHIIGINRWYTGTVMP